MYGINDFTQENYRKYLRIAKKNYKFYSYENYRNISHGIIWRHDIDMSLEQSIELAKIEKEENVVSTWFVHLHSEFYNILEKEDLKKIKLLISDFNGKIGLHFDIEFYGGKNIEEVEENIKKERNMLEDLINTDISAISFHNPDIVGLDKLKKEKFGGLINTYSEYFNKNYEYCSDSNGYWRFKSIENILLERKPRLQILTHPVWWQKEVIAPRKKIENTIYNRAKRVMDNYDRCLNKLNRSNIGKVK